jgi:c-di-AMP phosphodiesterase-like protein
MLGKNVDILPINVHERVEDIKTVEGNSYKFIVNQRRRIIHVIDNSEIDRLEKIIRQKQHAVMVVRLDYSDRVKYNTSAYAKLTARVSEILNNFASLTDGTLSISQTGDEIIIVSE